jgi:excinuclease UvrABC nuclease subunit
MSGKTRKIPLKDLPQDVYNVIVALDDEAHRFAITYHKKVRKRALLDPKT